MFDGQGPEPPADNAEDGSMKEVSLGPVLNEDGTPSDITRQMLAGTGRSLTPGFPPARPMFTRVTLGIWVDRNRVDREYNRSHSAAEIREWVRREAESATQSALSVVEAEVSLRD